MSVKSKVASILVDNGQIDESEREIYEYAVTMFEMYSVSFIIGIILSIVMHAPLSYWFFVVPFFLIRRNAGGYHASTQLRCYIYSSLIVALALFWCNFEFVYKAPITLVISYISAIIIMLLAPQDTPNKPMSVEEKAKFGRLARIMVIVVQVVATAMLFLYQKFAIAMFCSVIVSCMCLSMGALKNKRKNKN